MGFVLLGIAALNVTGVSGALFMMLAHGIVTGALFLLVGILYQRTGTMSLSELGGLGGQAPVLAAFLALGLLASMGLPGLVQFVGEFQTLLGAFDRWGLVVLLATVGILVTATFTMRVIGGLFTGREETGKVQIADLRANELAASAPLVVLTVALGLFPSLALGLADETINAMRGLAR